MKKNAPAANKNLSDAEVTARLNAVYADEPARIHHPERRAQRIAIQRADPDNQW